MHPSHVALLLESYHSYISMLVRGLEEEILQADNTLTGMMPTSWPNERLQVFRREIEWVHRKDTVSPCNDDPGAFVVQTFPHLLCSIHKNPDHWQEQPGEQLVRLAPLRAFLDMLESQIDQLRKQGSPRDPSVINDVRWDQ